MSIAIETFFKISVFALTDKPCPRVGGDYQLYRESPHCTSDDFAMNCVENYFDCLKSLGNRYPNNLAKAKIHTWLASQIIPDKRLAEAAEAGYWDFNHLAFESLKQFILSL